MSKAKIRRRRPSRFGEIWTRHKALNSDHFSVPMPGLRSSDGRFLLIDDGSACYMIDQDENAADLISGPTKQKRIAKAKAKARIWRAMGNNLAGYINQPGGPPDDEEEPIWS